MKKLKSLTALVLAVLVLFGCMQMPGKIRAAVKISQTEAVMDIGDTLLLEVTGTKKPVKWSSSDENVAMVFQDGIVIAMSAGDAVIKAKVAGKKLKCRVTVRLPLSNYWSEGSEPAEKLRSYVSKVTDPDNENFIPVKDRIAVFDMDGTLTCETFFTYFDTMMFIHYCLYDHPERVSEELKDIARHINVGYSAGEPLARSFAQAYAGMTIKELYDYAEYFGQKETKSFDNMRFFDGFYEPMAELVKYLYDNGFTIYVVSGTERTTSRAIVANSPIADYVSPAHIIGTEFEVKVKGYEDVPSNMDFKYEPGDELVFTGGFIQKNLNANKAIWIQREIGQMPVLAFGNSGSDTSMLNYALDKRNPYAAEAYMLVADDDVREWGDPDNWEKKSKEYSDMGYTPISMKNDFTAIYPEPITRGAEQNPDEGPQDEDAPVTTKSVLPDAA